MVQLDVGNCTGAREIEFWCDLNGWRCWNKTRVGFVIFFGRELEDRIARIWQIAQTWQAAHEIRMDAKPSGHDLWADIFEFEFGYKIRSIQ